MTGDSGDRDRESYGNVTKLAGGVSVNRDESAHRVRLSTAELVPNILIVRKSREELKPTDS